MKFCGKCGKKVDAVKCPYCNYTQDKTYISIKIRHSKKNYLFISSGIFVAIIIIFTLYWAINDGYGPLYDRGDFILFYEYVDFEKDLDLRITTENNKDIDNFVRSTQFFDNITDSFNDRFKLPYDVPIYVGECGETNAYWNYKYKFLVVCYELIDEHFVRYQELFYWDSEKELKEYVQGGVYWVIVHELGHAFITIYDLPLLGPQEDTADAAASIILISEGDKGVLSILAASDFFKAIAMEQGLSALEMAFYDTHGLSIQRYTDMLCFVYGSDTSKYLRLVTDGNLDIDKAVQCKKIYDDNYSSWAEQLKPYAKFEL